MFQKQYLLYQIFSNEPLIGGRPDTRKRLVSDVLGSARADALRNMLESVPAEIVPPGLSSGPAVQEETPGSGGVGVQTIQERLKGLLAGGQGGG